MLISAWSRSTSARSSSIEHPDFFFEPVQFHLQPPNLFVQRVAVGFPVSALVLPPVHEKLRQLLQRRLPPLGDLDRMHLELRSQLAEGSLTADRLDRHTRFELRTVLFSRRRHRPLLCQRLRRNLSLLLCLKSRVHYTARWYNSRTGRFL